MPEKKKAERSRADIPKNKSAAAVCSAINKHYGSSSDEVITCIGAREQASIERWSSGSAALDRALGGGWAKGRFVELFGLESAGKSTLLLHAFAEHQRAYRDQLVALIDSEWSFDEDYAAAIGVDLSRLLVHHPTDTGEMALALVDDLTRMGVGVIGVDSVAALLPKAEMEGNYGDTHVATQARMMSTGLRKLAPEVGKSGTTVFWTNQIRMKIGVLWGDPATTPAGNALRHWTSIRVHFAAKEKDKHKDETGETIIEGMMVQADVKKNKTAAPFKKATLYIRFGDGLDKPRAVLEDAIVRGVVEQRGAWFSFKNEQLGQGKPAVLMILREDPDMVNAIQAAIDALRVESPKSDPEPEPKPKKSKASGKAKVKKDEDAIKIEAEVVDSELVSSGTVSPNDDVFSREDDS